jgi:protoporphyrinogen oxidase
MRVQYLVVGAGVSGLAFADWLGPGSDYLILEADSEVGGYCKTVVRDGFVWDYSGHFFHFRHQDIEQYLVDRMRGQRIVEVEKSARIFWKNSWIDFPFQKNIHQLPKEDFIDCLVDLYFRDGRDPGSFREMLYAKFGRAIAEFFLVPYNEKLYATDLDGLDVDAMGRFFPHADIDEIIRNFRRPDNRSYNATFTYPEGGAIQYVHALLAGIDPERLSLNERLVRVDPERRLAFTSRGRSIQFDYLISSAPLPALLQAAGVAHDERVFSWNQVLVFNLGFDRKGLEGVHWAYFPQRELCFYRVGFYDNIFGTDRMSLYVELGYPRDAVIDEGEVQRARGRVLEHLRAAGVVGEHKLVAEHSVVLDPAYVHITKSSLAEVSRLRSSLAGAGVHSIGRYGAWTYCSIEDNIVEARALADEIRRSLASR